MKRFNPKGHRVLLLMDAAEKVTSGGIVIVDSAVEREQTGAESGVVLEIGPDAWYDKGSRWAEVGDRVYIARYAGKQIDGGPYGYPDRKLRVVNDEDILGTIEELDEA